MSDKDGAGRNDKSEEGGGGRGNYLFHIDSANRGMTRNQKVLVFNRCRRSDWSIIFDASPNEASSPVIISCSSKALHS